jgi:hypothetical protein
LDVNLELGIWIKMEVNNIPIVLICKEWVIIMHKAALLLAVTTTGVGLLLLFPISFLPYKVVLTLHVLLGLTLAIILIRLIYSHVPSELYNPFREGFKKWNGFKLLLYLFLAILSGIFLLFLSIKWIIYFHGFIGLWALLVGWKHRR